MTSLRTLTLPAFLAVALLACGSSKQTDDASVGGGHGGGGSHGGAGGKGGMSGSAGHGGTTGAGGSGTNLVKACQDGCKKFAMVCQPSGGAAAMVYQSLCDSMLMCSTLASCKNSAAILAAANVCLTKTTCTDLTACVATVTACTM